MPPAIVILEDNHDRWYAMQAILASRLGMYEAIWLRTAPDAILWFRNHLDRVLAISLDHDLETSLHPGDATDPGTGRDVANYLAQQQRRVPVMIHSTNVPAAIGMELELQEAGWTVQRVLPYEDLTWIHEAWFPEFQQMLQSL